MNLNTHNATSHKQKVILQAAKRLKIDILRIIKTFQKDFQTRLTVGIHRIAYRFYMPVSAILVWPLN